MDEKRRKGESEESKKRRGLPEALAAFITAACILGVASIGNSSTAASGGSAAAIEKRSAVSTAKSGDGSLAIRYADADRDVLDLQLD